jgi:hypothetical protein
MGKLNPEAIVGGVKVEVGVSAQTMIASARLSNLESTLLSRYMKSVGPGEKSLLFISSNSETNRFSPLRLKPTDEDSSELGSEALAIVTMLGTGDDEPTPELLSFFEQADTRMVINKLVIFKVDLNLDIIFPF